MANPTLLWTVSKERGTISFGRLLPLTGNTYDLAITGGAAGESYTFYVMDESGEVCLARSETSDGATTIAFNSAALRNQFVKEWHETRMFHCVCSNGAATIAEADLFITWNPVWTDIESGSAYSMRGPQGVGISSVEHASTDEDGNITYQFRLTDGSVAKFLAPRGPRGPATDFGYVRDEGGDNKWHKIVVRTNRFGEKTIDIEQAGVDTRPDSSDIVTVGGAQTITGGKTFRLSDPTTGRECSQSLSVPSGLAILNRDTSANEETGIEISPAGSHIRRYSKANGATADDTKFLLPTGKGASETLAVLSDFEHVPGNITAQGNVTALSFAGELTGDSTGNIKSGSVIKSGVSLEGGVTAVTQKHDDDSTKIATTAMVQSAIKTGKLNICAILPLSCNNATSTVPLIDKRDVTGLVPGNRYRFFILYNSSNASAVFSYSLDTASSKGQQALGIGLGLVNDDSLVGTAGDSGKITLYYASSNLSYIRTAVVFVIDLGKALT